MTFNAKYEREGSPGWQLRSWEDATNLLSYLKPDGPSSATFTLDAGSYVQCAGSKTRLTVEARVLDSTGAFSHYVLGKGSLKGIVETIECTVGPINVDESQVLTLRDARKIIRYFVEEDSGFPEDYYAQDVSSRFGAG